MIKYIAGAIASLALSATALAHPILPAFNLLEGNPNGGYGWLHANPSGGIAGGSYSAAMLVQDPNSAFFISDASPSVHGVGLTQGAGNSLTGAAGSTFQITSQITVTGQFTRLIQVQVTSLDSGGNPNPWVAAGVVGPNGPFTAWRLDIGSHAAGDNKIEIANLVSIDSSGFMAFNSAGDSYGTFAMTVNSSDLTGVSGVGVVGLGGADIAGFDMASIQMFWNVTVIPAPGALALLGVAGLLGVSRRRRTL